MAAIASRVYNPTENIEMKKADVQTPLTLRKNQCQSTATKVHLKSYKITASNDHKIRF